MDDIQLLQSCNSTLTFELISTLFTKKWNMNMKQKNQIILDFLNYFDSE